MRRLTWICFFLFALVSVIRPDVRGDDAPDLYGKNIVAYSHSQNLASVLLNGTASGFTKKGEIRLENFTKYYDLSKNFNFNTKRIDAFSEFAKIIGDQTFDNFAHMDRFMEDIRDKSIKQCLGRNDVLFAAALCTFSRNFLKSKCMASVDNDVKTACREVQDKMENLVLEKVRDRYDDAKLKMYVESYRKDCPAPELMIDQAKPTDFASCIALAKTVLVSFQGLDRYSAAAEFPEWGRCMLNVLLLCDEPILHEEFKRQLKLYRATFREKTEKKQP